MEDLKQIDIDFEKADLEDISAEKERKKQEIRKDLLGKVLSGNISNSRERVGYILNNYPTSRNSDIELIWNYWVVFENDKFDKLSVTKDQMLRLTRVSSLIRMRALIQNQFKLFQADDNVKKHRGVLEEEKKSQAIEAKPKDLPVYSVFVDETGKNQKYLGVGSLWVVDSGVSTLTATRELNDWKKVNNINYEFHFAELTKHKVEKYKQFFLKFLALNSTIGFKAIIIDNIGFANLSSAITDLTFHLIHKGILHENNTNRAPLPRILQVWLDEDEKGSDSLKLENLKERISVQRMDGLQIGNFEAINSRDNFYIQAVDLFTASINRKLHSESTGHVKDELADYIFELLKFDISALDKGNSSIDSAKVFNLVYNQKENLP
jgi:hypothetical protein